VKYKWVEWEEVEDWTLSLARNVLSSGFEPDAIVAIARGGLCVARILADALDVNRIYSFKVEHWGSTATITRDEAVILQPLTEEVRGKRILLVDDIVDTRKSFIVGRKHVVERGAKEVKTAAMQWIVNAAFRPDYYGTEVKEWTWFIYPWNRIEDLKNIAKKESATGDLRAFFKEKLGIDIPEKYLPFLGVNV